MKVKYGISAINWVNEDIMELGDHYTAEQVLGDMSRLGFEGTEFCRKFPRDTDALKQLLADNGMVLTSQWKSVHFSRIELREQELQSFREHADFLKSMGCNYVVTCETGNAFEDLESNSVRIEPLSEEQWNYMTEGLNEAGRYCKDNGMQLVYHYHGETVVEDREQIARLMEMTDPELVHMLYDTGHAYFGGSDPLTILRTYYDRIRYIHLKDIRQEVLDWKWQEGIRFRDAVRKGIFTVPGDGCIDFKPIFAELAERGYEGWMIIEAEQDPSVADPVEYAEKAKAYLQQIVG